MKIYKKIKQVPILDYSGYTPKTKAIPVLKRHQFQVFKKITIGGDAPKSFIRAYYYGESRKANPKRWSFYIAKMGHKWYPVESITEYLLNRIGKILEVNMAEARIAWVAGQIMFLSKYFINDMEDQELVHGADIYAGYLNDKAFVEEIEAKSVAQDFFTIQFTFDAIDYIFKEQNADELKSDFLKLILYDAYIGSNDRHFYNWGVIRSLKEHHRPYFSPIYDTARGLFWNTKEERIQKEFDNKKTLDVFIKKYAENSTPKIGWEGAGNLNHFKLVEKIVESDYNCDSFKEICSEEKLISVLNMIDSEFNLLLSKERIFIIKKCLEYRFNKLLKIFY